MAVRFIGDSIVDENGNEMLISYDELRKACVTGRYNTLSVKEIIFEGVKNILGERVIGTNYRKSSLFNALESEILADEGYQEAKRTVCEQREKYKGEKPMYFESYKAQYFTRNQILKRTRRKPY